MLLCGGLAVLYHHSTENGKLAILGAWLVMFLVLGGLVKRLEQRQIVSCPVRSSKTGSDANKVQAVSAEESQRETVKT